MTKIDNHSPIRTTIKHKFSDHIAAPETRILIVGTFNPDTLKNKADFFYSTGKNNLWTLVPTAFGEGDLKGKDRVQEKKEFMYKRSVDFLDLIREVDIEVGREHYRRDDL